MSFVHFPIDPEKENKEVKDELQQSIFNYCQAKNYCYTDGLQYDQYNCSKDSLKFLYIKSDIREDRYFPQQHFNMLAWMTFCKSTS